MKSAAWFLLSLLAAFAALASAQDDRAEQAKPEPEQRGLRVREEGAFEGYTLICPLMSRRTVLLDMEGRVVHEWTSEKPPGNSVYLKENGNILRASRIEDGGIFEGGGIGGSVQEYTWEGEKIWDFRFADEWKHHHHDIEPMPNGNVLLIAWERKSYDKAIFAGRDPDLMQSGEFWPDAVFEIEPVYPDGGKVVWEWHVWDHLIQDFDPERDNYGDVAAHPERIDINADRMNRPPPTAEQRAENERLRQLGYVGGDARDDRGRRRNVRGADWLHINAIDYNPELDQIVLSTPNLSEMWVIDHSTTTEEARGSTGGRWGKGGDLLYRWGNPQAYRAGSPEDRRLFRQHDAQWIEPGCPGAGDFLVFNNGRGREGGDFSTVDLIRSPLRGETGYPLPAGAPAPPSEPSWTYGATEEQRFYSSFISGAQRLQNGNTLICSGADGRILEVTDQGEIVWEYLNEIGGDVDRGPAPGASPRPPEGGPPPGANRPRGPRGRRGGGINPYALFRATRIPADHPGLAKLARPGG